MKDKTPKPIVVDAVESDGQRYERIARETRESVQRTRAEVELKTCMIVDKHNEDWAETLKRVRR